MQICNKKPMKSFNVIYRILTSEVKIMSVLCSMPFLAKALTTFPMASSIALTIANESYIIQIKTTATSMLINDNDGTKMMS